MQTHRLRPSVQEVVPGKFIGEIAILLGIGAATTLATLFVVYPALGISGSSPQPARTLIVVGILFWFIRRNGQSLTALGLGRFKPLWLLPILVIAFLAIQVFVAQPIGDALRAAWEVPRSDNSFLAHIQGNLPALIAWLIVAWIVGGFCEEVFFRGYLMNRVGELLHGGVVGWSVALVIQALAFGLLHAYLGFGGVVTIGIKALFSGAFFLVSRRNLWPLVFVHGLWDTLGFTLVYFNGTPTT